MLSQAETYLPQLCKPTTCGPGQCPGLGGMKTCTFKEHAQSVTDNLCDPEEHTGHNLSVSIPLHSQLKVVLAVHMVLPVKTKSCGVLHKVTCTTRGSLSYSAEVQ